MSGGLDFRPVVVPDDLAALTEFLVRDEWPFHGTPVLTAADVASMAFADEGTSSHWVDVDGEHVGLVRLLDLDDIGAGSPLFDVRIASSLRGHGVGSAAVRWLTRHLFDAHPVLHRIEATTRHDNLAMQRVLDRCGYRCEGHLRQSWPGPDGVWFDTLVYGILRSD